MGSRPLKCWPCPSLPRSGGTRQALYAAAQEWNDPTIKVISGFVGDYWAAFRQSKFCLAPHGHGWGIRLLQVGLPRFRHLVVALPPS